MANNHGEIGGEIVAKWRISNENMLAYRGSTKNKQHQQHNISKNSNMA